MLNRRTTALLAASSSLLLATLVRAQSSSQPVPVAQLPPGVDVWLDTDFYESGTNAQAFFNAVPGSYVVVVRVSTKSTLEVLYPASPAGQTPYARTPEARTALGFRTDPGTGLGLLYAISSDKPFDFSRVSFGGHWDRERLARPTGTSAPEIAGYFFNDIIAGPGTRFSMGQTAFINGAATYKVGDPGFPTVASVIDAAGIACNWNAPDSNGRVCGLRRGEGNPPDTAISRTPSAYESLRDARASCATQSGAGNQPIYPVCTEFGVTKREAKPPPPSPPPPPLPPPPPPPPRD